MSTEEQQGNILMLDGRRTQQGFVQVGLYVETRIIEGVHTATAGMHFASPGADVLLAVFTSEKGLADAEQQAIDFLMVLKYGN